MKVLLLGIFYRCYCYIANTVLAYSFETFLLGELKNSERKEERGDRLLHLFFSFFFFCMEHCVFGCMPKAFTSCDHTMHPFHPWTLLDFSRLRSFIYQTTYRFKTVSFCGSILVTTLFLKLELACC